MRSWHIFVISGKQKVRDRLGLALTLLTAPLFVLLYWLFFSDAPATYAIATLDREAAAGRASPHGAVLAKVLASLETTDGAQLFEIKATGDRGELERRVIRGEACLGLVIEEGFSAGLGGAGPPPTLTTVGDASSIRFRVAAALLEKAVMSLAREALGRPPLFVVEQESVGLSGVRTPFEAYVPGLLVFAVIMLIFSSSMSVVRELEAGTLSRLRLTPASSTEVLMGLSAVQLILGALSVLLTFATARLLGFRSEGSLVLAAFVAVLASLASIGIGMFVASLARTQARAFLISSVAMFLLVLFSGIVFPQPEVTLFTVAGQAVDLFDALPTTHMAGALRKVMTLGAGAGEVTYELVLLAVVGAINYALGAILLARTGRPSTTVWEGMV